MDRQKIIFPLKNKKPEKHTFSRFLFYFSFLAFWGAVIYILFFSPLMQITSIKISGNKIVGNNLILEEVNSQLEGKYLKIFTKNNLLLFGKNNLKNILLNKFRQIRDVQIKKDFPSELVITIQEREMKMAITSGEKYYLLDENGQAYDEAEGNNLIVLTDGSSKEINLGDVVLSQDCMNYILGIKDELKNSLEIEVENNFWTPSLVSNDIRIKTKAGWGINFSTSVKINKEIEMLKTVLNDEIGEDRKNNLEYIDLRIDNKIYYKFKQIPDEKTMQK